MLASAPASAAAGEAADPAGAAQIEALILRLDTALGDDGRLL